MPGNQQSNNPTYIVVMNTPMQQTSKIHRANLSITSINDGSPELKQNISMDSQMRGRSQSLSIHENRLLVNKEIKGSPMKAPILTPQRLPGFRRNTISSPSVTPARRFLPGIKDPTLTKTLVKRPSFDEHSNVAKPIANIRPDLNVRKLKLKATSDSGVRSTGPLKATIPVKKVAPLIVNRQNAEEKSVICNTSRDNTVNKPRSRYSYMSSTPLANKTALSPIVARRRTLSDRSSPKKVDGGVSKPTIRPLKIPQSITKTLNKYAVTKAVGVSSFSHTPDSYIR